MRVFLFSALIAVLISASGCDAEQGALEDTLPDVYTLSTVSSPVSGGSISPSGGEFITGQSIEIEARPAEGYIFDYWEGDLSGNRNPEELNFRENRSITAYFTERDYDLNISIQGDGSVRETVVERSEFVVVSLAAEADSGWIFDRWEGDLTGSDNPETITIEDEEKSVTAVFVEDAAGEYDLSVSMEGEGSVSKDPNRSSYTDGEEVGLTAQPASGWSFSEWSGALSGSNNPETIAMDEDKSVTAVFVEDVPEEFTLSIMVDGQGTVSKDPSRNSYTDGEEVTLTAQPASGWSFSEWSGDLSGSNNSETIVMDQDKSVTAVFVEDVPEKFTLSIMVDGQGSVSKDPNRNSYTDGEEVTLTAQPASGWSFSEWRGDLSGSNNSETIIMDENKSVTAIFEQDAVIGIAVDEVKLFITEMEMEGTRNSNDFETRNFVLNLPLDGSRFEITHTNIPAGFYDELELEIEKPGSNEDVDDPDFILGSNRYSLVVKGVFNGERFIFRSTEDFDIDVDIKPHLEITEGQNRVIAIDLDFTGWFRNSNGDLLDPSNSGNREQINENIEDSFSDFEDRF